MGECPVSSAASEPDAEPDADAAARRRRAAVAGHTGDHDTARLLLTDPDDRVRSTALGALERLGDLRPEELLAAFDDPSPLVRRRACDEATRWRGGVDTPLPTLVADALGARLHDTDDTVIEIACWACGERPPASVPTLDRLIDLSADHDDALVREAAVAALGALGDPRALPAILRATGDRATVRRRAVLALAPFDGPEVDAAIERARSDRDWQVRQAAEDLSP